MNPSAYLRYTYTEMSGWKRPHRFYLPDPAGTRNDAIIDAQIHLSSEVEKWCIEQFGPGFQAPGARWEMYSWAFYLNNADDAMLFRLRWS
ncbi:MAG: hypothetical protein EOP83_10870 [Verrucomicrobiaceae bacterium]|nr:MAG: hypothetical protein EOP83_10870 [Verrucomicrobiaceae bacterium]